MVDPDELSRSDAVLVAIPSLIGVGTAVGLGTAVSFSTAIGAGALLAGIVIGHQLFRRPPTG